MAIESPVASRKTLGRWADGVGPRDRLAGLIARTSRWAIHATGSGGGSTLPGRLAEWVAPGVLGRAASGLQPIVLVSATNGKTTTTALLSAALRASGRHVVTNSAGSNLHRGLTATVLSSRPATGCAVLEVDEATLPGVMDELHPDMLVLLNLSRDQLDRFHEVHTTAERWRAAAGRLNSGARIVAVDHDPLVCRVAEEASEPVTVGLEGAGLGRDSAGCPVCGALLVSDGGQPACAACGWRRRERTVRAELTPSGVRLEGFGASREASLPVASPGYAANVAAAWAAAVTLGVEPAVAIEAIAGVQVVESRYADLAWRGRTVRLLLAKNPAGWDDVLAGVAASSRPAVVSINAGIPDGRDTSWIWDVDMRSLGGRSVVVASGARAEDIALRLAVAGLDPAVEPDLERALLRACGDGGSVDLLGDYTSFQAARRLIRDG
jgi:UDP-N-acetylmuramyl tripeptide synthase